MQHTSQHTSWYSNFGNDHILNTSNEYINIHRHSHISRWYGVVIYPSDLKWVMTGSDKATYFRSIHKHRKIYKHWHKFVEKHRLIQECKKKALLKNSEFHIHQLSAEVCLVRNQSLLFFCSKLLGSGKMHECSKQRMYGGNCEGAIVQRLFRATLIQSFD